MIQWLCCKPGVNTLLESFVSTFRIDRAPACATSRAHRYPTSTFEEFSLFSNFSASPFVSFASATSFCVLFAARFLCRRRGAPFTFAPPGPVTPTAFGFTSLVSILYSTSSPYARVITVNHRQSRALARQKSPGVSAFRSPVPRVGGAFSHFRNVSSHLPQRTEPHRLDGRLMHEDLFRAIIRDDEPEPLRRVEPLHLRRLGAGALGQSPTRSETPTFAIDPLGFAFLGNSDALGRRLPRPRGHPRARFFPPPTDRARVSHRASRARHSSARAPRSPPRRALATIFATILARRRRVARRRRAFDPRGWWVNERFTDDRFAVCACDTRCDAMV